MKESDKNNSIHGTKLTLNDRGKLVGHNNALAMKTQKSVMDICIYAHDQVLNSWHCSRPEEGPGTQGQSQGQPEAVDQKEAGESQHETPTQQVSRTALFQYLKVECFLKQAELVKD